MKHFKLLSIQAAPPSSPSPPPFSSSILNLIAHGVSFRGRLSPFRSYEIVFLRWKCEEWYLVTMKQEKIEFGFMRSFIFLRIITDHVWWLDASPDRSRQPPSRGPRSSAPRRRRSVRFPAKWRMKNGLNFPPNFERLVLGCIDAGFCK